MSLTSLDAKVLLSLSLSYSLPQSISLSPLLSHFYFSLSPSLSHFISLSYSFFISYSLFLTFSLSLPIYLSLLLYFPVTHTLSNPYSLFLFLAISLSLSFFLFLPISLDCFPIDHSLEFENFFSVQTFE